MARITLVTDAWHPQVSGVVRTLDTTCRLLQQFGHTVDVIEPSAFFRLPAPFYPEISLAMPRSGRIARRLLRFRPDHLHIATEGPLGLLARCVARRLGWRFTTSYHTRFPEYLHTLAGIPPRLSYSYLRWFHGAAARLLVATPTLAQELQQRGFTPPVSLWSRGVDTTLFHPRPKPALPYPRPIFLYVGRISAEKGLEDFLRLPLRGSKVLVGDGPARQPWQQRYSEAVFLGYRHGRELAELYAAADLFVFPSRTDTFGNVILEALASGLPVAAYPAPGPRDLITDPRCGALHDDLQTAIQLALQRGDPAACTAYAQRYSWPNATRQFLEALVPTRGPAPGEGPAERSRNSS
ncbi:glycosyltransferase family 4 protein [Thermogemmata fonticola]|uniref:Glycosyltransferase family 1 protein n=1 Tax=Thermogemmata fonticola TaxID=2755323 RepID=A0A7V9ACH5_9BACT|nr:glycosyltransferase family 1 protein [Thermogemmata fonticola]MBA2227163.1 glycosyltransferase family 1 protein [Thermogemmata fonticola]